eukprot:scaffold58483_cov66-Phaeocystis_antarctica.AAC.4
MALSEGTPSANFSAALLALLTRVLAIVLELSEPMAPISRHATHPFDRVGERVLAFAIATAAFHAGVAVPHHKSDAALGGPPGPLCGRGCELRLLVLSAPRRVVRPTAHGGHRARPRRAQTELALSSGAPGAVLAHNFPQRVVWFHPRNGRRALEAGHPAQRRAPLGDTPSPPPIATMLQQFARDFNCLSDQDRKTRQRALQKLSALADGPQPELDEAWEQALRVPLLKLFSDTVEKNRELAIGLATQLVPVLGPGMLRDSLPYLLPVLVARLATNPVAEEGEELRLQLLQLLQLVLKQASGEPLAPHLPELVAVLSASYSDPFPDSKKAACAVTKALAEQLPTYIETHCAALVKALQPMLGHQHSRVRSLATEALVALLLCEASSLPEVRPGMPNAHPDPTARHSGTGLTPVGPQLALLASDRSPAVREQAVHSITQLLARMDAHAQQGHSARLLPLLLGALSDEVESIANLALGSLERLGELLTAPPAAQEGGATPMAVDV